MMPTSEQGSLPTPTRRVALHPTGDRTHVLAITVRDWLQLSKVLRGQLRVPVATYQRHNRSTGLSVTHERWLRWSDGLAHVVDGSEPHLQVTTLLAEHECRLSVEVLPGAWRVYRNQVVMRVPVGAVTEREALLVGLPAMGRTRSGKGWRAWRGRVVQWPHRRELIGWLAACEPETPRAT